MKKFYALLLILTTGFSLIGQEIDYSRKWFFGFNAGTTWQTTDVKNVNDYGWGFTVGKSYGYSYGAPISWDLRGRFLRGFWYGQDIDTTGSNGYNQLLSTGETNYYDSLGFGVHNFQNENYKINLELLLHANRFRARTGWDPYIFVGAGLSINQAYGDYLQYDTTGGVSNLVMYDLDPSQIGKSYLKSTQDGVWETALDGHDQKRFNVQVMPSLGFGIGRQFGPGHTWGLEHKTTFTLDDTFDGVEVDSKYSTDIYHYTNLYIQFRLKGQETEDEVQFPEIEFTDPIEERKVVNSPTYILKAKALHIDTRENLTFTMNNRVVNDFIFNAESDQFTSEVQLQVGENILHLSGVNAFGSDEDQVIIVYEEIDEPQPPVVNFIQPSNESITVNQSNYNAVAEVINVENANQIEVEVNGRQVSDFQFDTVRKQVRFSVRLNLGVNRLEVRATNEDGQAQDNATIHYEEQLQVQKPVVQFTNPSRSSSTVSTPNFQVRANVRHVEDRNAISFKLNGADNRSFSFDARTDEFLINVRLSAGQNLLEISGVNEAGQASDNAVIQYQVSQPKPPVVSISNPISSTDVVQQAGYVFVGRVLNVQNRGQVTLIVNGRQQQSFGFDVNSGQVTQGVTLNEGSNTFELIGNNPDGTDSKQAKVVYRKTVTIDPPNVNIYAPSANPFNTESTSATVKATIQNVTQSNQIEVQLNGRTVSGWTFNNGIVTYNVPLVLGNNVIRIEAENQSGHDDDQTVIRYTEPQQVDPPIVRFIQPSRSPYQTSEGRSVIKARVENVASKSNIRVKVNGQLMSAFAYSSTSQEVSFNTGLEEGANVIQISGTNEAGSDQASTTIVYRPVDPTLPPTVEIVDPSRSPYLTEAKRKMVRAEVENIDDASQITVQVNGSRSSDFEFNQQEEAVEFMVNLNEGNNTVKVLVSNSAGSASDQVTINYKKPVQQLPPSILFVNPESPGGTVASNQFVFVAKVDHIDGASQLTVRLNGQLLSSGYQYDQGTKQVQIPSALNAGNNVLEITANNGAGSARASTTVNYKKKSTPCDKPVIGLVSPTSNSASVRNETLVVKFTVSGVNSMTDVRAEFNGTYAPIQQSIGGYQATFTLKTGLNAVKLFASNPCGVSEELLQIKYVPDDNPCDRPTITLISPQDTSSTTEAAQYDISLAIRGISSGMNVQTTINGETISGAYATASRTYNVTVPLTIGWNVIEVNATNACGTTGKQIRINRTPCLAPNFALESANVPSGGSTYASSLSVTLDVDNVQSSNQLQVKVNGRYKGVNFNSATNSLQINTALVVGTNTVDVLADNGCGTKTYRHQVIRKQDAPKTPPSLTLVRPSSGKNTVDQAVQSILLNTKNINASRELAVKLNGRSTAFSFDEKTGALRATLKLREGKNHVVVTAVNSSGTATAELYFTYQPKVVLPRPVIRISQPSSSTTTVNAGVQVIKGNVSGLQNGGSLTATVNGKPVRLTRKQVGTNSEFSFVINVSPTHSKYAVVVTARNASGQDVEKRTILLAMKSSSTPNTTKPSTDSGLKKVPTKRGN